MGASAALMAQTAHPQQTITNVSEESNQPRITWRTEATPESELQERILTIIGSHDVAKECLSSFRQGVVLGAFLKVEENSLELHPNCAASEEVEKQTKNDLLLSITEAIKSYTEQHQLHTNQEILRVLDISFSNNARARGIWIRPPEKLYLRTAKQTPRPPSEDLNLGLKAHFED